MFRLIRCKIKKLEYYRHVQVHQLTCFLIVLCSSNPFYHPFMLKIFHLFIANSDAHDCFQYTTLFWRPLPNRLCCGSRWWWLQHQITVRQLKNPNLLPRLKKWRLLPAVDKPRPRWWYEISFLYYSNKRAPIWSLIFCCLVHKWCPYTLVNDHNLIFIFCYGQFVL